MDKTIIPYQELTTRLLNIPNQRDQAFLITTYLTLARVSEITGKTKDKGLHIKHIEIKNNFLRITLKVLKAKSKVKQRIVPIPLQNNKEAKMAKKLLEYIIYLEDNAQSEEKAINTQNIKIFPFTSRWGEMIFEKWFPEYGSNIHYLRHARATHLRTEFGYRSKELQIIGGWKDTRIPDEYYSHLDYTDLEKMMEEKNNGING